jgi:hypothetical protein
MHEMQQQRCSMGQQQVHTQQAAEAPLEWVCSTVSR